VPGGKAHGENRQYQVECRDVLVFRDQSLVPYTGDGIDVPFKVGSTEWSFDVALRARDGGLVLVECRRIASSVKQSAIASFAYAVERVREGEGLAVAGVVMTKTGLQIGAVALGYDAGIQLAVLGEGCSPPSFNITFLRYDPVREKKLHDYVMHVESGHLRVTGHAPAVLRTRFGEDA
jgi:hypothetical protein